MSYTHASIRSALLLAALALTGCEGLRQAATRPEANRSSIRTARNALADGQAQTALSIARGVLTVDPKNVGALTAAGDADAALNNRLEAAKYFRQALAIDSSYVPAHLGQGKLKLRDDVKGAEADFRAIVAANPKDTAALTDLGVALDLQERHKEAQAYYVTAISLNPDIMSARVNLGLSLALSGDAAKAEDMLRDAAQAGPTARVRADFAVAELLAGHKDKAEATLQADLTADEAHASVEAMNGLLPPDAAKK